MKINQWTLGLAAAGVVSLGSVVQAEEASEHVMTAVSGTQISGYVSTSAIWKFGTGTTVPFRAYDGTAKQDQFNLDVVNLTVSKPLDEGEWAAGYKAELLFGPDANALATSSTGFNISDFNIKQAYVALRAPVGNGIDLKVGVWDTIIGYEVFNAGDNPNYSRSFGYLLEPTTYTGLQASYRFSDSVAVVAGVANGQGVGVAINGTGATVDESEKSYMAGFTLTAPDSWGALAGSTLSAGVVDHASGAGTGSDIINWYVGGTFKTGVEGLTVGASYDYQGRDADPTAAAFYANAIAGYVSYQATEKMKLSLRGEYASGSSGTAAGVATGPFSVFGKAIAGSNTELFGVTGTVDYSLWENVISRLELRWDSDVSGGPQIYGLAANPDKNAVSVALNVIYKF
ncbi:MAG: outer membrane beta-barrel protein [Verrucomicrobiota bacterium]